MQVPAAVAVSVVFYAILCVLPLVQCKNIPDLERAPECYDEEGLPRKQAWRDVADCKEPLVQVAMFLAKNYTGLPARHVTKHRRPDYQWYSWYMVFVNYGDRCCRVPIGLPVDKSLYPRLQKEDTCCLPFDCITMKLTGCTEY